MNWIKIIITCIIELHLAIKSTIIALILTIIILRVETKAAPFQEMSRIGPLLLIPLVLSIFLKAKSISRIKRRGT